MLRPRCRGRRGFDLPVSLLRLSRMHSPARTSEDQAWRWPPVLEAAGMALVLAAALIIYGGAFRGFFVQDDFGWLESTRFRSLGEYLSCFFRFNPALTYRPLSQETYFWLVQKVFGLWPAGFHLGNVGFHLLGSVLVYQLLRRFASPLPSLVATLFYAAHGAHLWAIYWISAVPEPMALVFYVAAVIAFIDFDRTGSRRAYAASLLAMVAGILSKESILSLPVVLAAYAAFFAPRRLPWTAPFVGLSALYVLLRFASPSVAASPYPLTFGPEAWLNLKQYLAWAGGISDTLIRFKFHRAPEAYYGVIALGCAVVLALLLAVARDRRLVLFALVWFAASLQPVLYFSGHSYPYYLAPGLAGIALALAAVLPPLGPSSRWRALAPALVLAYFAVWTGQATVRREGRWWNERTFEASRFVDQVRVIDRRVPPGRIVYLVGLGADVLGVLQQDAALKAYGFSPARYIVVALDARTPGQIRHLAAHGELGTFHSFVFFEGVLWDWTETLRSDPEALLLLEQGTLDRPDVRLESDPATARAGRDTLVLRLVNFAPRTIDVLYTFENRLMPLLRNWDFEPDGSVQVRLSPETPKGVYRYVAVRDSTHPGPKSWIRVDREVEVR